MEVQVLRVLVIAEVRDYAACAVLIEHLSRDATHLLDERVELAVGCFAELDELRNVCFGNYDDVVLVRRPGVVEGENIFGLENDVDSLPTAEHLLAVPVVQVRHQTIVTGVRCFRRGSLVFFQDYWQEKIGGMAESLDTDIVSRAREMLALLDAGDVAAATPLLSQRIRRNLELGWSMKDYLRDLWQPGLEELTGSRRTVTDSKVLPTSVRLTVEGSDGHALVTIRFDQDGAVDGFALDREIIDGIANFVINCPDERVDELETFYGALIGIDKWRLPMLVFDEGNDYHAPAWGDPDRPQQMHSDIRVRDLEEAETIALAAGATRLHDATDHVTFTDPIGHAFCLYPGGATTDHVGELWRIAIDCPNPGELAAFYEEFLGMTRVEESATNVVITAPDRLPMLSFEQVSPYVPPRWPDPAQPAQMHFDITFDDAPAAIRTAERLGAIRLPPGGSCPVYADPVGHPFCLCMHGQ